MLRGPRKTHCRDVLPSYMEARTAADYAGEPFPEWKIPRRLYSTFISREVDCLVWKAQMSWIERNPEFEYFYFDDADQELFMRERCVFQHAYTAWRKYRFGASRKDLFAWCLLYMHGGFFLDVRGFCRRS